jgi:hypothetical protein
MTESQQKRSSYSAVTSYGASALVASLGFSILLASASIAYAVAQSLK